MLHLYAPPIFNTSVVNFYLVIFYLNFVFFCQAVHHLCEVPWRAGAGLPTYRLSQTSGNFTCRGAHKLSWFWSFPVSSLVAFQLSISGKINGLFDFSFIMKKQQKATWLGFLYLHCTADWLLQSLSFIWGGKIHYCKQILYEVFDSWFNREHKHISRLVRRTKIGDMSQVSCLSSWPVCQSHGS